MLDTILEQQPPEALREERARRARDILARSITKKEPSYALQIPLQSFRGPKFQKDQMF